MIDLHMHTKYSDGTNSVEEILKLAQSHKLDVISITDHDTCLAYKDVELNRHLFSGDIKYGIEMTTSFLGYRIEVLGYDFFDYNIINEYFFNFYNQFNMVSEVNKIRLKFLDFLVSENIKFDHTFYEKLDTFLFESEVYESMLLMNDDLKQILKDEYVESPKDFFRKKTCNPKSKFFIDYTYMFPKIEDVIELIQSNGGKTFLAHPVLYGFDLDYYLPKLIENTKIDGLECYHTKCSLEQTNYLIDFVKSNNLLKSGGSDFHGSAREDYYFSKAMYGTVEIENNIIEDWR